MRLLLPWIGLVVGGCGTAPVEAPSQDAGSDRARLAEPIRIDSPCPIVIETPPLAASNPHVPPDTVVAYASNPPASGPHYAVWAAYTAHEEPVDRRNYVHDLEHGAVVLLYKCESASACPDLAAGLKGVAADLPADPACAPFGVRAKIVVTPDPKLDVPVAAAAWGWTYKAQCLDPVSLLDFARAHYGQGTESTCADGLRGLPPAR